MPMDDKGGMSGYSKPKNKPNSKEKIAARKLARKESGMSAQKFYVKTRMAEAAKSGKTLDRAALRQKFQSGDVARKGFGAPKKKTGGSSSSSTGSSSTGSSSPSKTSSSYTPGMGGSRTTKAPVPVSAPKKLYGPHVSETTKPSAEPLYKQFGGSTKESKAADKAKKIADRNAKYKSDQAKKKSDYDNSPRQKAYKATLAASNAKRDKAMAPGNAKRDKAMSDYRAKQDKKKSDYDNSPRQKAYKATLAASDAKRAKAMADNKAKQDAKKKKK